MGFEHAIFLLLLFRFGAYWRAVIKLSLFLGRLHETLHFRPSVGFVVPCVIALQGFPSCRNTLFAREVFIVPFVYLFFVSFVQRFAANDLLLLIIAVRLQVIA